MSHTKPGLRFAGDHYQTLCCGLEAIPPTEPERAPDSVPTGRVTADNDVRWPAIDAYDDVVSHVCPECGRTWRTDDCVHDNVDITPPKPGRVRLTDGSVQLQGTCRDCDTDVALVLTPADVRELDELGRAD